jgi:formylglycine-generating enzyme required for sulfatase activity
MMPLGAGGRADLVRALGGGEDRLLAATAALLGYAPYPPRSVVAGTGLAPGKARVIGVSEATATEVPAAPLAPALFWLPTHYQALADGEGPRREEPLPAVEVRWTYRPQAPPVTQPLCPWRSVQPRLRARATLPSATHTPDMERIVEHVSRGLQLDRVPYERRLRWGPRVQLILDRSERLVPIWTDQEAIARRLAALLPAHALEWGIQWDGPDWPRLLAPGAPSRPYRLPPPGSLVLVLGDLGCANRGDPGLAHQWQRLAAALREAGCRPVALSPLPAYRCAAHLRDHWTLIPWERHAVLPLVPVACAQPPMAAAAADATAFDQTPDQKPGGDPAAADLGEGLAALLRSRAGRLLRLVSPAVRIEPGLLRAVRLLLPAAQADVGTELDAWQHPALVGTSAAGATLDPAAAARLRAEFAAEPDDLQRQVLALLRLWRGQAPQELWFEEVLSLAPGSQALLPDPRDLELAEAYFRQLSQRARGVLPGGAPAAALAWYRRCERRLPPAVWGQGPLGEALQRLSWALHRDDDGYQPRPGFDPGLVEPLAPRTLDIRQRGDRLEGRVAGSPAEAENGAPLLRIQSGNGLVQIAPPADPGPRDPAFWEGACPPGWAKAWGWDRYGAWASFAVQAKDGSDVVQRLRWIPPGTFQMGSPEDEPGRWDDEGPRHPVTLADGYWLFDTPCIQALWAAVMGKNPSRFQSPERPVEQVSWEDVQGFLVRINAEIPGLALVLPTEAQWEHACRAGTETALYSGPIEILGDRNAPALDPIAWYGGNSGVGFELEDGYDSSDWPEVQHPNPNSGTHPVGRKDPNPWGLFDMLGNVWEWTLDAWHDSYSGAPVDGSAWETTETGADRVIRGGSWVNNARYCRCAYRYRYRPDLRSLNLGFRCARVQER